MSDGRETAWLLLFDEQGKPFELFSGHGAEDAARRRFEQASLNWNCHLFEKIAPLDCAPPEGGTREAVLDEIEMLIGAAEGRHFAAIATAETEDDKRRHGIKTAFAMELRAAIRALKAFPSPLARREEKP